MARSKEGWTSRVSLRRSNIIDEIMNFLYCIELHSAVFGGCLDTNKFWHASMELLAFYMDGASMSRVTPT
jgi:hypothetical protein